MFTNLVEKLREMELRIKELEIAQEQIESRQLKILSELDSRKKNREWLLSNWWRIVAITAPVLFMLGEIIVYIRKVV